MSDHFAAEAHRLLNDDTLNRALDAIRQDALEKLALAPFTVEQIFALQSKVAVIDEIRAELRAMIIRQGTKPDDKASPFA